MEIVQRRNKSLNKNVIVDIVSGEIIRVSIIYNILYSLLYHILFLLKKIYIPTCNIKYLMLFVYILHTLYIYYLSNYNM